MPEVAILLMESKGFHSGSDESTFCKPGIHKIEIHGDIFIPAVDGNARTTGKNDIDFSIAEFLGNESGKFQSCHF
jgi:hypothetical protein